MAGDTDAHSFECGPVGPVPVDIGSQGPRLASRMSERAIRPVGWVTGIVRSLAMPERRSVALLTATITLVCLSGVSEAARLNVKMGPSAAECAKSWDASGQLAQRREIPASGLVRATILVANSATCELHFLAKNHRVFIATGTWNGRSADGWRVAVRPRSYVSPQTEVVLLPGAKVRATGHYATIRYPIGPAKKQLSGTVSG